MFDLDVDATPLEDDLDILVALDDHRGRPRGAGAQQALHGV